MARSNAVISSATRRMGGAEAIPITFPSVDGFREGLNPSYVCAEPPETGKSVVLANSCPAPFAKIFPFAADPNQMHIHHRLVPIRGAIARRHERGAGCGGRGSVRRCQGMAGRVDKARELTNGTQTNDA